MKLKLVHATGIEEELKDLSDQQLISVYNRVKTHMEARELETQSRLSALLTKIEELSKEAELLQDIWKGDGRPQYNEGYENALKAVKSLIKQELER